jgi:hypothetical protein
LRAAHMGRTCTRPCATFEHVGAPADRRAAVKVLSGLYRALGRIVTGEIERRRDSQSKDARSAPEPAIDPGDWVEAILESARHARQQSRTSIGS